MLPYQQKNLCLNKRSKASYGRLKFIINSNGDNPEVTATRKPFGKSEYIVSQREFFHTYITTHCFHF